MSDKPQIKPAPMLSLSASNHSAERTLTLLQEKTSILDRLLGGESALSIANQLGMTEKEINAVLKEGLETQRVFFSENASTIQMMIYQRHEALYELAIQNMQMLTEDGAKTDINWFREARAQLKEIQSLILPFLKEAKPQGPVINLTIEENSPLYNRIVGNYADIDVFGDD